MHNNLKENEIFEIAKENTIPILVLIEVCYTCNESCIHCCLSDRTKKGLSLKQYEMLFDQLVSAGTLHIILTGGEPFSRKDFIKIIEAARRRRLSVTIFTNGLLLSDNIISKLEELFVHEIHISIYSSNSRIHDMITQIPNSFEESMNSIKRLIKKGIKVVIKCPIMNFNALDINSIKKLAADVGAAIRFSTLITAKNNGDLSTLKHRLTENQLREIMIDPELEARSDNPINIHDILDCIPCDAVLNSSAITPDGEVYLCNDLQLSGGNVTQESFGAIWKESEIFTKVRNIKLRQLNACIHCELIQFCTRCPGLALLEDNDLLGCSSAAKMVAKIRKELNVFPLKSNALSKYKIY